MFIKVLYVVLVLCMVAVAGTVIAAYLKIRKQMRESHDQHKSTQQDKNISGPPSGV